MDGGVRRRAGPWSDPAYNPKLTTFMIHADTSADLTQTAASASAAALGRGGQRGGQQRAAAKY